MKLKITLTLFFILVSLVLHGYLTSHYYPLRFGLGPEGALCNVGETFNCDAVAASSFASFVNIPLSVWGLATNLVLLVMVLIFWLGLTERTSDWKRWTFYVSSLSLGASLVMAVISATQLTVYCLLCIILYFLSFGIFLGLWWIQEENPFKKLASDLKSLVSASKPLTLCLVAIPVVSGLTHASIIKNYEAGELNNVVNALIREWQTSPSVSFDTQAAFTLGAPEGEAKLIIAEFADFRCGHCKSAAPSLHAFTKAHSNEVHFKFYNFPLDSECNADMPSGDGVSCRLAKAVTCADNQEKALALHDHIFENQQLFQRLGSPQDVDEKLKEAAGKLSISFDELQSCMNEAATHDRVVSQVQQGVSARIRGTPTVFVNSRRLERGQMIPVLQRALQHVKNSGQ